MQLCFLWQHFEGWRNIHSIVHRYLNNKPQNCSVILLQDALFRNISVRWLNVNLKFLTFGKVCVLLLTLRLWAMQHPNLLCGGPGGRQCHPTHRGNSKCLSVAFRPRRGYVHSTTHCKEQTTEHTNSQLPVLPPFHSHHGPEPNKCN